MNKTPLSRNDVRYWQDRLFRHERRAAGKTYTDSDWSVRIAHEGRREAFQLGIANKIQAAPKARAIYQYLIVNGWPATIAKFKTGTGPIPSDDLSIGEFLAELKSRHPSKANTIESYAGSLRKIAANIAGIPSGGRGGNHQAHRQWREKVETLKLSILTPNSVRKWKEEFLTSAGADPVRQRSACVSVNTFLNESKTLFSPKYLEGLSLVPSSPFNGIKLESRRMPRYQSTFDVLQLVKAACEELADPEPQQFAVFVLAVMAGLRRNEIDKLQWDRFNWTAGTINVTPTEFFRTKSVDSTRTVGIPAQMVEMFRGLSLTATSPFVIESKVKPNMSKPYDHYRCQAVLDSLLDWLRSKGVTSAKPLHTLRKEFGSLIAQKFGIYAAKEMLGHADITTTAAHYLEAKEKPVIGLGPLLSLRPDHSPSPTLLL
jgi:integrase